MIRLGGWIGLLCLWGMVVSVKPGIKVAIRQQTLVDLKDYMLPEIVRHLKGIYIPPIEGKYYVNYKISNIYVDVMEMPARQVSLSLWEGTNRISFGAGGISARSIRFVVDWWLGFVSGQFYGDAYISEITIIGKVVSTFSYSGRPIVYVQGITPWISSSYVTIICYGSIFQDIYQYIVDTMKDYIVTQLCDEMQIKLASFMDEYLERLISQYPSDIDFTPELAVNWKLVQNPITQDSLI